MTDSTLRALRRREREAEPRRQFLMLFVSGFATVSAALLLAPTDAPSFAGSATTIPAGAVLFPPAPAPVVRRPSATVLRIRAAEQRAARRVLAICDRLADERGAPRVLFREPCRALIVKDVLPYENSDRWSPLTDQGIRALCLERLVEAGLIRRR